MKYLPSTYLGTELIAYFVRLSSCSVLPRSYKEEEYYESSTRKCAVGIGPEGVKDRHPPAADLELLV